MLDVWYSLRAPAPLPCLDAPEEQRRRRFLCQTAREDYARAHSFKRRVLSLHDAARAPKEWSFVHGAAGKPVLMQHGAPCFNLSHSGGCVAVALADVEVGVDIERHRPMAAAPLLAERVFHPSERRWLAAQPVFEDAFFRLWTLKEALLKAAGTGFSQPPDQVAWEGLDEPWAAARFAGRRWHGIARRLQGASLAVALDGEAPCARLLRVEATQAHDGAWRVSAEQLPEASTHPENESEILIFDES